MTTMPIGAINPAAFTAATFPVAGPTGPTGVDPSAAGSAASAASGHEFGSLLLDGLDRLEGLTDRADSLAVQAATGDLDNIHDYTIAASEAQVATQLTVAVRNKALEAFSEIMHMQV
ncbi:flagellar hook-basal body complex protein FliE [Nocardioides humilatus]|uniref:Flagellar hook-basal body complex protein FliE n=1 Tax=Nocardioides humilatus TaxID=2607660 RepID=A0A5B1LBS7_9ACTN|nr:flagellar hook-basal body complex protein FliE [Nocardioides humilatus]KAA1417708.1 flagellar hook-basal body complex protein FliE [Nocardioides humilatus]